MNGVLVGRTAQRSRLLDAVERSTAGESQVIWISGPAGSGKTALVDHLVASLPTGAVVRRAWADPLARDRPLDVAAQLAPIGAEEAFAAGLELLDQLAGLGGRGPVVVVVEDLHWADEVSRQALLTFARRLERDHVLLLITSRDADGTGAGSLDPSIEGWERLRFDDRRCRQVRADPLDADAVSEWCVALGLSLRRESVDRLVAHTRGHPLHLRTLLEELSPEQLDRRDGRLPAPRTLAMTTIGRLAERSEPARDLCAALAVLGGRHDLARVATCAEVDDPDAALENLLQSGFVQWWPTEPGTPIAFTHPLYRSAVYDDLAPATRRRLHRAAVDLVDPGDRLGHRLAASLAPDPVLADDLLDAATTAIAAGDASTGANRILDALTVADPRDDEQPLLLRAASLLLDDARTGAFDELRPRIDALAPGPERDLVLGRHAYLRGDMVPARSALARSLAAATENDDPDLIASAGMHLAILEAQAADGVAAASAARAAIAAGERAGGDATLAADHAWSALAVAVAVQRGGAAGLDVLIGRIPARPAQVTSEHAPLLGVRGMLGYYAGRTTAAIADLRRVVRLARDGAGAQELARAHVHLAQTLLLAGSPDESMVHARQALAVASDQASLWVGPQAHAALAAAAAAVGDLESAAPHLDRARAAAEQLDTPEARYAVALAATVLHQSAGEPGSIVDIWAERAAERGDAPAPTMTALEFVPALIDALLDLDLVDVAAQQLDRFTANADDLGLPFESRRLRLEGRLALAAGDAALAADRYDAALAAIVDDDPMLDRLLLHQAAGELHLRRGRRREGVDQLYAALDAATSMGARRRHEAIERSLRDAGISTGGGTARHPVALTDREHDVAVLVIKGLTNKEAAAELYVSSKAVEFHLRNIYAKFGIRSRQELRRRGLDTPAG